MLVSDILTCSQTSRGRTTFSLIVEMMSAHGKLRQRRPTDVMRKLQHFSVFSPTGPHLLWADKKFSSHHVELDIRGVNLGKRYKWKV